VDVRNFDLNVRYYFHGNKLGWEAARKRCQSLGVDLLMSKFAGDIDPISRDLRG
jgi:hypothetical protein